MSEILKDGLPCVVEGSNQINSEGLPEASYVEKQADSDMDKLC